MVIVSLKSIEVQDANSYGHLGRLAQSQQFTYGLVREGVIAENFPQISANFPQNFLTQSNLFWEFPRKGGFL